MLIELFGKSINFMQILIVTQYFWPESFRINDLCCELASRGHKVTVLTGKPNYPSGNLNEEFKHSPEKFDSYNGISIVRVPLFLRGQNSAIKLVLNYFSYALSASVFGAWKLRKKEFDIIFVFEPSPVTVGLPAVFLKFIKKNPLVFWVQDLWPDTLEYVGVVKSKVVLRAVGKLVSFIYNRSDLILGQSRSSLAEIKKYCSFSSKVNYFPNWSEDIFLNKNSSYVEEITNFKDYFKVLFAGNIGEAQDLILITKAVSLLKDQNIKVKLFIVGEGRSLIALKNEVNKRKLNKYIVFLGRHPLESMPSFYNSADALLVSLKNTPVFSVTIPSKIQSYMAARKPILTMLSGEGSKIVEEAGCGYIASSGDYKKLALNVINMSKLSSDELKEMGTKARRYSDIEFNRDKLISQLEGWFIELLNNSKGLGKETLNN